MTMKTRIFVPANLRPFVETLGEEDACKLFLECGGSEIYLTDRESSTSSAARIVGPKKAVALAKAIYSGTIKVPLARKWVAAYLHQEKDWPIGKIARTIRADQSTVRAWLGPAPKSNQPSLFD